MINGGTRFPSQFLAAFDLVIGYESTGADHDNTMFDLHACCERSVRVPFAPEKCTPRQKSSSLAAADWRNGNNHGVCPQPKFASRGDDGYCKGTRTCDLRGFNCRCVGCKLSTAGVDDTLCSHLRVSTWLSASAGVHGSCGTVITAPSVNLVLLHIVQASQEGPGSCAGLLPVLGHLRGHHGAGVIQDIIIVMIDDLDMHSTGILAISMLQCVVAPVRAVSSWSTC